MSSRTRLPERESDFSWEDPYDSRRRRHTPPSRGPRKVALPALVVAVLASLFVGWLVGGRGGTTTVTESTTVTEAAAPAAPTASGAAARPTIDVAVLNGSDENGLAARTAELLRGMGYQKITEGNSPNNVAADRVMYRPGAERHALQVAADLRTAAPVPLPDSSPIAAEAPDADVVVVMGPPSASRAGTGSVEETGTLTPSGGVDGGPSADAGVAPTGTMDSSADSAAAASGSDATAR